MAFFPEDPPGFYKVPFGYNNAEQVKQSLLNSGFSRASVERVPAVSKIRSADRFARGLVFGNPLFEEITLRGGDPEEVCAAVSQAIEQKLGSEMPLQALFVQATRD